jgi:hypothetical protein
LESPPFNSIDLKRYRAREYEEDVAIHRSLLYQYCAFGILLQIPPISYRASDLQVAIHNPLPAERLYATPARLWL